MKLNRFFIYLSILISLSAHAILEVNVIKDKEDAFPIIVAPFDLIGTFEMNTKIKTDVNFKDKSLTIGDMLKDDGIEEEE